MNIPKRIVLSLVVLCAVNACAKRGVVQIPLNYLTPNSKYAVVAIQCPSRMYVDTPSDTQGILNTLIKDKITSKKRNIISNKLCYAMGNWKAEDVLRDKIHELLSKKGIYALNIKEIVELPSQMTEDVEDRDPWGKVGPRWYNPDKTCFDHSEIINTHKVDMIIEAGYWEYRISQTSSYNPSKIVTINCLVKVVRADNGQVIGRVKGRYDLWDKRGIIGEFDLNNENEIGPFVTKFKEVFNNEVELIAQECVEKLGL